MKGIFFQQKGVTAIVAAFILLCSALAKAQTQPADDIVEIARGLNGLCRGSSGDTPHLDLICDLRDKAFRAATKRGYCYGKKGQFGAQMEWHRCTNDSLR
ncbi:MAG: hypothetical protein KIT15_02370 [Xanthobacteraceae bacterium]|nr:hypothetical protein [Xanthobacteraceae bacterium]